jgi:hypothetical protein
MGFTLTAEQIVELHQNGQMDANGIKAFAESIKQDFWKHPPEQVFGRTQAPALSFRSKIQHIEMNSGPGGSMTDHKEAIKNAIQAARHSGLSSGEIIQIVEVEFTKADETSSVSKKAITSEDVVWNPLTEDLKKSI